MNSDLRMNPDIIAENTSEICVALLGQRFQYEAPGYIKFILFFFRKQLSNKHETYPETSVCDKRSTSLAQKCFINLPTRDQ